MIPDMKCPEQRDARGAFVTTYSGAKFFIEEGNVEDVPLWDIAHALAMNCRFNGHLKYFYSVAEHSIHVANLSPPEYRLEALMHDVSEAFLPDVPRPFKRFISGFDGYEESLHEKISEHYNLVYPLPPAVAYIDKHIVRAEAERLYKSPPSWVEFYDEIPGADDEFEGAGWGFGLAALRWYNAVVEEQTTRREGLEQG